MTDQRNPLMVGVFIFDGVEVLDFAGPFEVFSVSRSLKWSGEQHRLFTPIIISEERRIIRTTGDLRIEPHFTLADHPPLDLIVVPGGFGTRALQDHEPVLNWIGA